MNKIVQVSIDCKPKNRIMCPDCGRAKMLFETEAKAKNFIKFNGDDIHHDGELRVYFCPACGGYHISSKEYKKIYDSNTDKLIAAYKQIKNVPTVQELILINKCFEIIESLKLKDRKKINQELKTVIFSSFTEKIKEKAKLKYYKTYEI